MSNIKNTILATLAIVLAIGVAIFGHSTTTVVKQTPRLGGITNYDQIALNASSTQILLGTNNTKTISYSRVLTTTASSTLCVLPTPSATSTLVRAIVRLTSTNVYGNLGIALATSSAPSAPGPTPGLATSSLISFATIPTGIGPWEALFNTPVGSTTNPYIGSTDFIGPNLFLNTYIDLATSTPSFTGYCSAEYEVDI